MRTCDVVIVGGGPAGSTCAWKLREAGLDVIVLERATFPRDKPCGGWITPAVLDDLRLDPEEYREGRVFQPITGLRTGRIGRPALETRYQRPVSFGIRRCEFDHYLLQRSRATVISGFAVTRLRQASGLWEVNDEVRAPLLVGAGGHFCPVARMLGSGPEAEPVVVAQEVEFRMDSGQLSRCRVQAEVPELYFCPDGKGYGWCFRKGDFLNVGFGRLDRRRLAAQVSGFVRDLTAQGRLADLPDRWRGHAYLLYPTAPRPLIGDGVLLLGDAAGLAHTLSGEGIRPAVESGLLGARAVLATGGRYRREDLQPYRSAIEARFGRRGPVRSLTATLPPGLLALMLDRLLSTRWLTRHVLLDRWFLQTGRPALAASAGA
jgi:flavin-dependent dehydrogenase